MRQVVVKCAIGCWFACSQAQAQLLPNWTSIFHSSKDSSKKEGDADWLSYRDVYKRMIWFDKYGKPKNLISSQLRVIPQERGVSLEGVRLTLNSKSMQVDLSLDTLGRVNFPFIKSAYDENGELEINRKLGQFAVKPWISILIRADGVYDVNDLKQACEQARNYLRYTGSDDAHDHKCVGVRFAFPRNVGDTTVRFRSAERDASVPVSSETVAFQGDASGNYRVFIVRFADWPERGAVQTQSPPLGIGPQFE